ncbi:MAG: acetate--CoA ligase [Myxococcales bacterium]|nr:MAG: acetate--CoA ligase [Myxococcales bacterium]
MAAGRRVEVSEDWSKQAWIDKATYEKLYQHSIDNPEDFWAEQAKRLDWIQTWSKVKDIRYDLPIHIRWFEGGKLNACYNCIDRHLPDRANKTAIIWEGDENHQQRIISYQELHDEVCRFAGVLRKLGVKKGDRVTIYLPMIPELAFAVLACARIGAVHSVIFAGFSPHAIANRIENCKSDFVITADEGVRGAKHIPLKANVDEALQDGPTVRCVLVLRHTMADISWFEERDRDFETLAQESVPYTDCEAMDAEDPLFILYTSGSTGSPKGVVHTTGGYLVHASLTHQYVFDCKENDIYWCTADIGWITGHSYILYGPLANGCTTLMFEGVPTHPTPSRFWEICDKYSVSIFYTAPTAIRALMRLGDHAVEHCKLDSLRLLGSVGEPINPEAWEWYHRVVGKGRCPIVDTWWQTETGGILITPLPGAHALKPGSAGRPFFGVKPALVSKDGNIVEGEGKGDLVLLDSWPGQTRGIYGNQVRFEKGYFEHYAGKYFSGDEAYRDADGDYWILGRVDDVLNVSGHRLGTAEIEGALVAHPDVAESAVVAFAHDIKGQGIYAFVTLNHSAHPSHELQATLKQWVAHEISPIARPDFIQFSPMLPKTRSGKIMRRILRKIAANDYAELGDTSTLADPSILQSLIDERLKR